jgi:hypothetical protein
VDDAGRVRVGKPFGDLRCLHTRERLACKRSACDELHDDARQPVDLGDVECADERGMLQARGDSRLAQEAASELRVTGQVLGQHLQRDGALELLVPPAVDDGHPAAAELGFDPVGTQSPPPPPRPWPCLPCPWSRPCGAGAGGGTEIAGTAGTHGGVRSARACTPATNVGSSECGTRCASTSSA